MAPADNWEAFQKLSGHRLVDSFGCLRGVVIPDELDEPIDGEDFEEMLYRWVGSGYSLRSTRKVILPPPSERVERPYSRAYTDDDFRMSAAAYMTNLRVDRARSKRLDGL